MPTRKRAVWSRLVLTAAGSEVLYLVLDEPSGAATLEDILGIFSIWAGLFVFYAVAVRSTRKASDRLITSFIFVTSLLFRATRLAPSIEWPTSTSSWPDGQLPARLATMVGPEISLVSTKAVVAGADVAALALAPGLLKAAGLPTAWSVIYGWNPLVVEECAAGHDLVPVGLLLFVIAIRALQKNRRLWAAIAYGTSPIGGWGPVTCLPLLVPVLGGWAPLSIVLAAAASIPAILGQTPELAPLMTPSVGASLLAVAASLAKVFVTRKAIYPLLFCWGIWLLVVLYRAQKRLEPGQLPGEALLAWGGFLMVSPQVLPWHFVPIAYLAAFSHNRGWLVFTATAPITYPALANGAWSDWNFWLGFLQYFPAYFALIFGWLGPSRDR